MTGWLLLTLAVVGTLVAKRQAILALAGLVEWESDGRKVTVGSPTSLALISTTVMGFGALSYYTIIATSGGSAPFYSPPAAPTVTSVVLAGDTSAYAIASAFSGDGDDTHDYSIFQWDTVTDAGFNLAVDTIAGPQLRDTVLTNPGSFKAGGVYKVRVRHAGVHGGESEWSAVDTFTASPYTFGPGPNEPSNMLAFLDLSPADPWGDSLVGALGSGTGGTTTGLTGEPCLTDFRNATTIVADASAVSGYVYNVVLPDTADYTPGGLCQWLDWAGHTPDATRYPSWGDTIGEPDSLYMRFKFRLDNDFRTNSFGAKFVGWETRGGGANGLDAYLNHRSAGEQSWRWQVGGGAHWGVWINDTGGTQSWLQNTDYDIEILYVAQVVPGDSTGIQKIWVNGSLQHTWRILAGVDSIPYQNLNIFTAGAATGKIMGFYNFPYYDGGNLQDRNQVDTIFIDGLYFSGSITR